MSFENSNKELAMEHLVDPGAGSVVLTKLKATGYDLVINRYNIL